MKSLVCLFVFSLISSSLAYIITVDSHSEECFFDNAQAGVKLGTLIMLFFQISLTRHIIFTYFLI